MRERAIIGDRIYEFSPEILAYLLRLYQLWLPIQSNDHFLLKMNNGCLEIETETEHIVYHSTSKRLEDQLALFNFDWVQLPRKFLTCLWYAYETWQTQNTTNTDLAKHRFYLSIVDDQYIIHCRQHLDFSKGWMHADVLSGVDATLSFTFNPICIVDEFFCIRYN